MQVVFALFCYILFRFSLLYADFPVGLDLLPLSQGVIDSNAIVKFLIKAFKCSLAFSLVL